MQLSVQSKHFFSKEQNEILGVWNSLDCVLIYESLFGLLSNLGCAISA